MIKISVLTKINVYFLKIKNSCRVCKSINLLINKYESKVSKLFSSKIGFLYLLIIVLLIEFIFFTINVNKVVKKEIEKPIIKAEKKQKIRLKTIKPIIKKTEPIAVLKPIVKPKAKLIPKPILNPKLIKKQIELAKKTKKLKAKRLKEEKEQREIEKEKKKREKIKKDKLEKEKREKIQREQESIKKEKELQAIENERIRIEGIRKEYIGNIRNEIAKYQKYPLIAKAKKEQGIVMISIIIDDNGSITNIVIRKTSGYKRLDKAALRIFKKMKNTYKIPKDLNEKTMNINIPISFKLN